MALPAYVIEEVRRQIKEEGLRYVQSDVVVQKTVDFDFGRQPIKTKRYNTVKTPPATQSKSPDSAAPTATNTASLNDQILYILADARTLLMPLDIQKAINADRMECRDALAELLDKGVINRVLNGRYTLSELGADTLTAIGHPVCTKACARISYYNKFPDQLTKPKKSSFKPCKTPESPLIDQEKQALSEMCKSHVIDDEPTSVDKELAAFEGLFVAELNDLPTKIKIISKVRSHFTGDVAQHLIELEQYLLKKAG
jgi:hypothetical protein